MLQGSLEPASMMTGKLHLGNSVHLWQAKMDVFESVEQMAKLLSAEEITRAERFRFPVHRRRFIAAHAFLRSVLSRYMCRPAQALQFCHGERGKPFLVDSDVEFVMAPAQ